MTDIRKDFELHAISEGLCLKTIWEQPDTYRDYTTVCAWSGYQAGRAHDIDGLIAELKNSVEWLSGNEESTVESIIRKHFGKE